jgi:transposase-like protein
MLWQSEEADMARRYSAKFKFQVVRELLSGDKSGTQVTKAYGIHSNTARNWKNTFLERGLDVFAEDSVVAQYEQRIAERVKDTYGLNRSLAAPELPKSTWYYHQNDKVDCGEKYGDLKLILEEIAREHPKYGLPRSIAELREVCDCGFNRKVVGQLLRLWDLRIVRGTRRRELSDIRKAILEVEDRADLMAQMDKIGLFRVVYTDFTELSYADEGRKSILMAIVPRTSKLACGWAVGEAGNAPVAPRT